MPNERNADETAEAQNHPSVNRRSFVKALGTAGTVATGFSGMSSAEGTSDREVTDLKGGERSRVISAAMSSKRTKKIQSKLSRDGWEPKVDEGVYLRVDPIDAESYRVAVIPFEKHTNQGKDTQSCIAWTDRDMNDVDMSSEMGFTIENFGSSDAEVTTHTVGSDRQISTEKTNMDMTINNRPENGISTDAVTRPLDDEPITRPPGGGGGGGYDCATGCLKKAYNCDLNLTCIAGIAFAAIGVAGAAGSCAVCAGSGGSAVPACGICLAAFGSGGIAGFDCVSNGVTDSCNSYYRCSNPRFCN